MTLMALLWGGQESGEGVRIGTLKECFKIPEDIEFRLVGSKGAASPIFGEIHKPSMFKHKEDKVRWCLGQIAAQD
jgi:hypothetical protein